MPQTTIYNMDVSQGLGELEDNSVDCIITSPPYYGLRNYKIDGQIGLEKSYTMYLAKMLLITADLKRVLKPSGTFFLNMGDSYASKGGPSRHKGYTDPKYPNGRDGSFDEPTSYPQGNIPAKSLMQIPERLAIKLVDEQRWILRNSIIWNKPNAMPTSADDRFSNDFEYVFFFVKQEDYYFKQQLEKSVWAEKDKRSLNHRNEPKKGKSLVNDEYSIRGAQYRDDGMRNKRAVWEINTEPYAEAHFACYPTELVSQCLKAGFPDKGTVLDPFAGSGTTLQVAREMGLDNIGIEINPNYIQIIKKRLKANEWLDRSEFKVIQE